MLTRRKNRQGCLPRTILIGIVVGAIFVYYDQTLKPMMDEPAPTPTPEITQVFITPTPSPTLAPTLTPLPMPGQPTTEASDE